MAETEKILLAHGGGGELSNELISKVIVPAVGSGTRELEDSAPVPGAEDIRFTTDSHVVKPIFFPGGDIGRLAVHGTLNDLAVSGAVPLALSLSLIIEEGLELKILEQVLESAGNAARENNVSIVTGDTKVVARGETDRIFVITSAVGRATVQVHPTRIREGDRVIVSGFLGDHGVAVMSAREGLRFKTTVRSDSCSVWPLVYFLVKEEVELHAMRDPTRGGLAASCNELADAAGVSIILNQQDIPVRPAVSAACEMLGLDPVNVPNEGKFVMFVPDAEADRALGLLSDHPLGKDAAIIGEVIPRADHAVLMKTAYGGERIVEMPYGEELPRIC